MSALRPAAGVLAALLAVAAIVLLAVLDGYPARGEMIVIGTLGLRGLVLLLTVIAVPAGITALVLLLPLVLPSTRAARILSAVAITAAGVVGVFSFFTAGVGEVMSQYYSFTSPDGDQHIVVEERTFLLAGSLLVYSGEPGDIHSHEVGRIGVDDGANPLAHGRYRITWLEAGVRIEFEDDRGWHTENVRL